MHSAEETEDFSSSESNEFNGTLNQSGPLISGLPPTDSVPRPPEEIKKPEEKRAVRVSEPIQQAQLIARFEPRYPPLALQTRKEGTVVLHAIISRDGRIAALEVVSGSPWFDQAALEAVRQWRYRPTYLGGEPVEVETTITVIFRLSQLGLEFPLRARAEGIRCFGPCDPWRGSSSSDARRKFRA